MKITYKEVWDTLSKVDVNDHIETVEGKKMTLSYLSWAWAWGIMMEHYPTAEYTFTVSDKGLDIKEYADTTASVECTITIGDLKRSMWLPVMDYRHNAIVSPNALQISNAKMRCFTKCMAMWGLGHYIYAGEDVPHEKPFTPTEEQKARFQELLASKMYDSKRGVVKDWWKGFVSENQIITGLKYMEKQVSNFNEKQQKENV
jgi:hypothetical protein